MMGFAFGRVRLVHAFEVRRAQVPDLALVAALNPSYRPTAEAAGLIE